MFASLRRLLLCCLPIMLMPATVVAVGIPDGVVAITAPEVRRMVEDDTVLFVNVLSHIEYEMQHIPGSVNIPLDELDKPGGLPDDKDANLVFYCNGMACPYSRRAAELAVELGYTRVHWFRGGILEWRNYQYPMRVSEELQRISVNKLPPAAFAEAMKDDNVLVVDVRPRWWRSSQERSGMVPGTDMQLPLLDLHRNLDQLPAGRPILLVDRLMRQSLPAAKYLTLKGYRVVGVLRGGTRRWVAEGRPVLARQDEPSLAVKP